jgi:hypothetical protein
MDLGDCPYATHVLLCMQKSYGFVHPEKTQFSHYEIEKQKYL